MSVTSFDGCAENWIAAFPKPQFIALNKPAIFPSS